jgi:hypothetical protein
MLQDSLRVSRGWRNQNSSESRMGSAVNADLSNQILTDRAFTCLALCEEPPSLAELLRPNSTTSFLF